MDPIDRQVAIDAINTMFAVTPTQMDMKEDCLEIIENLPSAQPNIIYCRNCKYYCHEDYGLPYCNRITTWFYAIDLDDFCSKAERKEDG